MALCVIVKHNNFVIRRKHIEAITQCGYFIVLDVNALAFAKIINMRETGPWETDWIVISSEEATG